VLFPTVILCGSCMLPDRDSMTSTSLRKFSKEPTPLDRRPFVLVSLGIELLVSSFLLWLLRVRLLCSRRR
jgi:hypothetical protein